MKRALAAVAALCLCLAVDGASAGGATCGGTGPTLLQNDLARVYHDDADEVTVVCSKRTRLELLLGDDEFSPVFPPPGIDQASPFVAAAIADNAGDDPENSRPETDIAIVDVRALVRGRDSSAAFVAVVAADRGRDVVRVGRVVVTSSGDAAWTSCPASQNGIAADPRPNCVRPGAKDTVWALRHNSTRTRFVARGTAIAPRSVRLRNGRVSWIEGGKRRSAPLR